MNVEKRQARRVAARWAIKQAMGDWQPPIPREALEYFHRREAYLPDTPNLQALDDARDSIGVFLPKILQLLTQHQGDRYHMSGSESQGKIFYFFSPRQPIDAFNLTLAVHGERVFLTFGYTPYRLDGMLDFANMLSDRITSRPEVAGLALMRLVRSVLSKVP